MATTRSKPASKTSAKPAAKTRAKLASKVAKPAATTPAAESTTSMGRVLDARPDRLDFRDRLYAPPLHSLPAAFPSNDEIKRFLGSYVKQGLILNQGTEGACTGFGLACVANYLLWVRHLGSGSRAKFESVSPRMFYELAKRYDEWPGQDYDGSSCRGALKGWHKHGVCACSLWAYPLNANNEPVFERPKEGWATDATQRPLGVYYRVSKFSVVDIQAAIAEIGAVYVSAEAHDGWDGLLNDKPTKPPLNHGQLPVIAPVKDPKSKGGHAFALVGYNERGFIVQNSWGERWGTAGFAILPYDDWALHATDAWACALGVALSLPDGKGGMRSQEASRWRVASGRSINELDRSARQPNNPVDDAWPLDHAFLRPEHEPWPTDQAYLHTLVAGNEGRLMVSDITRHASDAAGHAQEIVVEQPLAWFKGRNEKVLKLALYAHGGLNSEGDSIDRIRVLAPYFAANGIYPLFVSWKTGVGETLSGIVEDWARKVFGPEDERAGGWLDLGEAKDRAIEALGHVVGKGIWGEMRENAACGVQAGHLLDLLAQQLQSLAQALQKNKCQLELHLIGHSAGSILLGHLLTVLGKLPASPQRPSASSCTLYAAACSVRFAVEHYLPADSLGVLSLKQLHLYQLSDANECGDGLPSAERPVYGKSLLYLVSRALDDARKMPLLGMERSLLPAFARDATQWEAKELPFVQQWQKAWSPPAGVLAATTVTSPKIRQTRMGDQAVSSHGSFDNNIEVLTQTLERIKGGPLVGELEWLDY
ncbi:C1 family peptidase [Roseateles toxinivorans]|uniref:Papain like protease n=1 Tax=Roseateles toxinivorans TaxID=270368 RepID=A0A4R6QQM9_9BURK|nr:C1 family peptidase [Roseateles toxinivorans]TDP72779.1 papain like protease [Roseateles toxinivorans]